MKIAFVISSHDHKDKVISQLKEIHGPDLVFDDESLVCDMGILVCEDFTDKDGWHAERFVTPNKPYATILDYAENIERHELQEDIFTPEIKAKPKSGEGVEIEVVCPACGAHSVKKKRCEPTYQGLAHDAFGNFLISGTEQPVKWEDGEPVLWEGETLTMQVLDPTTMDEFGDCGFKEIPVPAHYSRRCSNPEAYVLSGKPIRCEHRYSSKVCPECHADNDIAARHCIQCKERLVDPNEKLTEKAGQAGIIAMGETKIVQCLSAKYEPYQSGQGRFSTGSGGYSVKATYMTEIGAIVAWHTVRQHWIFNRLAEANGVNRDDIDRLIDAEYSQCAFWTVAPHQIKVKKSEGQNGYAKFEVKQVEFLEEQVMEKFYWIHDESNCCGIVYSEKDAEQVCQEPCVDIVDFETYQNRVQAGYEVAK